MWALSAMAPNVFQARAVPVVRKVKCTNVQRNAKMQNEQAWILLGVMPRALFFQFKVSAVWMFEGTVTRQDDVTCYPN